MRARELITRLEYTSRLLRAWRIAGHNEESGGIIWSRTHKMFCTGGLWPGGGGGDVRG